ncbi:MAG: MBOAT family O-acyltransferase, partial [Gemmatimonadota bacterium]
AGLGFLKWTDARHRRLCLIIPITVDLLLLGFFKYAGFFLGSLQGLAHLWGAELAIPVLHIVLPVGISFYTFHTITYIVDSYRGTIRPTRNLFEFAAYVSLFSQLVAGPIVRFRQIEEDLENLAHADRTRWLRRGLMFFVLGMIEKVVVADSLASFVDPALADYRALSSLGAWLAMLGYTFQLYFDFAGYSDMAVGLGFLFGIRIPQNFNSPYKSTDPSDFWRRWHISLSSCLRDYLYIPLGGNRNGAFQTYRNLVLTMLIGGLWHGANWTFVVWGAYHGLILGVYRSVAESWDRLSSGLRRTATFLAVVVGWVFFRAADFTMALDLLHKMFWPVYDGVVPADLGWFLVALLFAGTWAMLGPNVFDIDARLKWRREYGIVLAGLAGCALAVMSGAGSSPFLYFQF